MPPSEATIQYPCPSVVAAIPTIGALRPARALTPSGASPKGTTELAAGAATATWGATPAPSVTARAGVHQAAIAAAWSSTTTVAATAGQDAAKDGRFIAPI